MKIRLILLSLAVAFVPVSGLRAQDTKPAAPAAPADKPDTELGKVMGKMNKAWRPVRQAARDGKLSPAIADYVATMIVNAEAAKKMTPELEADQPAGDRAKFHADYQAAIRKPISSVAAAPHRTRPWRRMSMLHLPVLC